MEIVAAVGDVAMVEARHRVARSVQAVALLDGFLQIDRLARTDTPPSGRMNKPPVIRAYTRTTRVLRSC